MNRSIFSGLLVFSCLTAAAQTPTLRLTTWATGLFHPTTVAATGPGQLLVGQTNGQIRFINGGQTQATPVLDIGSLVNDLNYNGIFGICVHPTFAQNRFLYVQYFRKTDKAAVVVRYTCNTTTPLLADPATALLIMARPYPGFGHRSGHMAFGPDGYLYITTGDSDSGARGGLRDPGNMAQNPQSPFGKILRIDIDAATPYGIPPTNPYASPTDGIPDELYGLGLRNPWRWSFDRLTGDLWLADVGQDEWEELTVTPAGSPAPQNYGWPCYEGAYPAKPDGCAPAASYAMPLLSYAGYNNNGQKQASITGGYVYRGTAFPDLRGWYVYGDWSQGTMWTLRQTGPATYQNATQPPTVPNLISFGEDTAGEVYVLSFSEGTVYRVGSNALISGQTGAWQDATTWLCACLPTATSQAVVQPNHTAIVNQPSDSQTLILRGTLRFSGAGAVRFR